MFKSKLTAIFTLTVLACSLQGTDLCGEDAIPIAEVKRDTPVDFQKEILPIFRSKCLACHNASERQGELVLESPAGWINWTPAVASPF